MFCEFRKYCTKNRLNIKNKTVAQWDKYFLLEYFKQLAFKCQVGFRAWLRDWPRPRPHFRRPLFTFVSKNQFLKSAHIIAIFHFMDVLGTPKDFPYREIYFGQFSSWFVFIEVPAFIQPPSKLLLPNERVRDLIGNCCDFRCCDVILRCRKMLWRHSQIWAGFPSF